IDTLIGRNFLKMYSTSADKYRDIIANWGNDNLSHDFSFQNDTSFDFIGPPFSSEFFWSTKNSICFPKGCGQICMYGLIFNSKNKKPFLTELAFFPNMSFSNFVSDNNDLYLTAGDLSIPSLIVNSVDRGLRDTIKLASDWIRGMSVYHIIDQVKIS